MGALFLAAARRRTADAAPLTRLSEAPCGELCRCWATDRQENVPFAACILTLTLIWSDWGEFLVKCL